MNATTIKIINKRLSNQKLVINAFSALPIELALHILEYIPIKIYFKPKELTFYTDHLLNQNDFQMIPDALRKNSGFMNKLIKRNPKAKEYVLEPTVDDDCSTIQFNQDQYNYYRKFALLKVSRRYGFEWPRPRKLSLLCAELRDDKRVVLTAIELSAQSFKYASDNLKNDKEVALTAVKKEGSSLAYASPQLKNDKQFVLTALQYFRSALNYASDELKNDKEIVLTAVQKGGCNLSYASDNLKKDREIVFTAVKNHWEAIKYASEELKNDREIVFSALQQSRGYALKYASEELKNDRELVLEVVRRYRWPFKYASEELKKDPEIVLATTTAIRTRNVLD